MVRNLFLQWAIKAALAYITEHGDELLERIAQWIADMADRLDNKDETFAAPAPVAGAEDFCQAALDKVDELQAAA